MTRCSRSTGDPGECASPLGSSTPEPGAGDGGPVGSIPTASVARLATYLHVLRTFSDDGVLVTSSGQLAEAAGVNPAILRKDLSHVSANGVRGVGYQVSRLTARIALALKTGHPHRVALAGAGFLGQALIGHTGIARGFRVAAMFDTDPAIVGTSVHFGEVTCRVHALSELSRVCGDYAITMAVIATPQSIAQQTADAFIAAGVRQILNVTGMTLSVTPETSIRSVDLALELQVLAFDAHRAEGAITATTRPSELPSSRSNSEQRRVSRPKGPTPQGLTTPGPIQKVSV